MRNLHRCCGAALPEVVVATALLSLGGLGALAMVHQIILQERLYSRQVMLYWQSEALNARLQLMGPPAQPVSVEWTSANGTPQPGCPVTRQPLDTSVASVIEDWSQHLSCFLPEHRGRVDAAANTLRLSVDWPRAHAARSGNPSDAAGSRRTLDRYWRWRP